MTASSSSARDSERSEWKPWRLPGALVRLLHQLGVEPRAEVLAHHAFHDARDLALQIALSVNKFDRHARLVAVVQVDDPLHLAVDGERLLAPRDEQLEQELRSD